MNERQIQILRGLVREYIREAQPQGSASLAEALNIDLSPASVRTILRELDVLGYTQQPHTSAGRVPTDKGYRYFVDHAPDTELTATAHEKLQQEFELLQQEYHHFARATSKLLAKLSHAMAVSGFLQQGEVHEAGLQEVMRQPEGESVAAVKEISAVLEKVDHYLESLATPSDHVQVFIGEENPFFPAQHTSLLVKTITNPNDEQVVLLVVGPKRMHYPRNISIINAVASIIKDQNL